MQEELMDLIAPRRGHFRLESGHHRELWVDLDSLFLKPARLKRFAVELATRLSGHNIDAVCGPLTGGAFLAQMIACELSVEFFYAERLAHAEGLGIYSAEYHIPPALHGMIQGKRVAIVDDVINAGSAVRAILGELKAHGADPVVLAALLALGPSGPELARKMDLAFDTIATLPNTVWLPAECPLCASLTPLENLVP